MPTSLGTSIVATVVVGGAVVVVGAAVVVVTAGRASLMTGGAVDVTAALLPSLPLPRATTGP